VKFLIFILVVAGSFTAHYFSSSHVKFICIF
jgi:hypothetical protein